MEISRLFEVKNIALSEVMKEDNANLLLHSKGITLQEFLQYYTQDQNVIGDYNVGVMEQNDNVLLTLSLLLMNFWQKTKSVCFDILHIHLIY